MNERIYGKNREINVLNSFKILRLRMKFKNAVLSLKF